MKETEWEADRRERTQLSILLRYCYLCITIRVWTLTSSEVGLEDLSMSYISSKTANQGSFNAERESWNTIKVVYFYYILINQQKYLSLLPLCCSQCVTALNESCDTAVQDTSDIPNFHKSKNMFLPLDKILPLLKSIGILLLTSLRQRMKSWFYWCAPIVE